ncbi:MAG: proline--tRNA ligase [Myxococcaceae bacterium]|nr:proline--tRNA ligase [Myxococcaceae bacterium]MBH2006396.1 proline--tRNA ligase [Myxococcaceae bacterium]
MSKTHAISPTRSENYPEWYQQVIRAADLAENSPVRGCMVVKPWGFGIWELIQQNLDRLIKETGHENAYFPLLIPVSFLAQEAQHVEGFAKECAVVTHHRLEADGAGGLRPAGELEEPYVIRPTSETIIGHSYAKWVQSYRDLPILINQWANVMRWEMRPRIFLRTTEFLWQEGHTVHATAQEAEIETLKMLDVYEDFARNYLALPVLKGTKTPDERFPGAVQTYCIEAMMQDGKALQAGTSHFLGQNFAKASGIKFTDESGSIEHAWTTSWGVSTRLIGGLIMAHSDDDGLVLPPKVATKQVVILPIHRTDEDRVAVHEFCERLKKELIHQGIRVLLDTRDIRGGEKTWSHIKKGVPVRVEVGPKDLEKNQVVVSRRDRAPGNKQFMPVHEFVASCAGLLEEIQQALLQRAEEFQQANTRSIDSVAEFEEFFSQGSGFALCHWNEAAMGHELLQKHKVTPRCIPMNRIAEKGVCLFTGRPSSGRVVFAKSY